MAKRIRKNHNLYIAPKIRGYYNHNNKPEAFDEINNEFLNPHDIDDKIIIYERQVKKWFLHRASRFLRGDENGFIVLMICLSYLEGVEQYRKGESSNRRSNEFFRCAVQRIYPDQFTHNNIDKLYKEGRCGLFHNGMVRGSIIINKTYRSSIFFDEHLDMIKINPKKLLDDIKEDFNTYLSELQDNNKDVLRRNFDRMFNNLEV